jgi:ankyrin repeat protein
VEVLKYLEECGIDLTTRDYNLRTPAPYAAGNGHVEVLQCLYNLGVKLDHNDNARSTLLHYVVLCGQVKVLMYLHENGAPPANVAAAAGQVEVLKYRYLQNHGVDCC